MLGVSSASGRSFFGSAWEVPDEAEEDGFVAFSLTAEEFSLAPFSILLASGTSRDWTGRRGGKSGSWVPGGSSRSERSPLVRMVREITAEEGKEALGQDCVSQTVGRALILRWALQSLQ